MLLGGQCTLVPPLIFGDIFHLGIRLIKYQNIGISTNISAFFGDIHRQCLDEMCIRLHMPINGADLAPNSSKQGM